VAATRRSGERSGNWRGAQGDLNLVTSCEHLREIGNRASHLIVFQAEESVDQPATVQARRKLGERWRFDLAAALGLWYLVVKICDVNVEDFSNAHHHGRGKPVSALFVFLNLLERDTERFAQIALAHFHHDAPRAQPVAEVSIDWLRASRRGPD
jgi:hypothetical protein